MGWCSLDGSFSWLVSSLHFLMFFFLQLIIDALFFATMSGVIKEVSLKIIPGCSGYYPGVSSIVVLLFYYVFQNHLQADVPLTQLL